MYNEFNPYNLSMDISLEDVAEKNVYSFIRPTFNYTPYHWFLECLPPFLEFDQRNNIDYYYILPHKHYIVESLLLCDIPLDKLINIGFYPNIKAKQIFVNHITHCWDWPLYTEEKRRSLLVKQVLLKNLPIVKVNSELKLFISREDSDNIRIDNNEEVKKFLIEHGFTIVVLNNLTLIEQIQLFRQASCVIGAQGAGLVNIMFCQPNTKIIELFNPIRQYITYRHFSETYQLQYMSLTCPVADSYAKISLKLLTTNTNADINIPITVDTKKLVEFI